MWPGPRPTAVPSSILIHPAVWPQYMGRKLGLGWGVAVPHFGGRGAGSPSNTMWPVLRLTSAPSIILILPTVWPQYANVTAGFLSGFRMWGVNQLLGASLSLPLLSCLLLQARLPGTRCQTISVIRRLAKTLLGDYWRHTCLRCTSARSALEAFA